jgi:hypothetical protein
LDKKRELILYKNFTAVLANAINFDFAVYQCDCEELQTFVKVAGADVDSFSVLAWFGGGLLKRFNSGHVAVAHLIMALLISLLKYLQFSLLALKLLFKFVNLDETPVLVLPRFQQLLGLLLFLKNCHLLGAEAKLLFYIDQTLFVGQATLPFLPKQSLELALLSSGLLS